MALHGNLIVAGSAPGMFALRRANRGRKSVVKTGLFLCLSATGCCIFAGLLWLSAGLSVCALDAFSENLSKLEEKFFQHDYPKDEKSARIERLEKFVFGEAKTGSDDERLNGLLALVPNLNEKPGSGTGDSPTAASPPSSTSSFRDDRPVSSGRPSQPVEQSGRNDAESEPKPENIANRSSYPAITAIEKKLLGRDYVGESVDKRLERLEVKAFGKKSGSDDPQERMDKLKAYTGVDVAKAAPAGSDWADEDETADLSPQQPDLQPFTGIGGGGSPYGRDLRRDMQNSVGRSPRNSSGYQDSYAGTGTFGAGAGIVPRASTSSPGRLATGEMPPTAPDLMRGGSQASAPSALGMNQQLALLEKEVFRKAYSNETIPARLNRLEATVFPQEKAAQDKSLPERVNRLIAAVPISQTPAAPARPKVRRGDPDFPDMDDIDMMGGIPTAPPRGQGGLSKIMNGLGNMLGGGGSYVGGYPVQPGTLVTDPGTGMLFDQYTGTLIDPMTGAVVGRRASVAPGYGGGGYSGFNSGFAPASPYGMGGSGMGFGFGGSGIRFGSGMWP